MNFRYFLVFYKLIHLINFRSKFKFINHVGLWRFYLNGSKSNQLVINPFNRETMKSILLLQSCIKSNLQFDLVKNFKFPFLRSHTEEVCTSGLQFFISIRKLLLWRFPISLKPIGLNIILSTPFRTSSFKQKIQPFRFLI